MWTANIFSQPVACLNVHPRENILNFGESKLIIFFLFLWIMPLVSSLRTLCPTAGPEISLLCFLPIFCIVLHVYIYICDPFGVNDCTKCEFYIGHHLLHIDFHLFQHYCWEDGWIAFELSQQLWQRSVRHTGMGLFLPVTHYLDYCNSKVRFQIR